MQRLFQPILKLKFVSLVAILFATTAATSIIPEEEIIDRSPTTTIEQIGEVCPTPFSLRYCYDSSQNACPNSSSLLDGLILPNDSLSIGKPFNFCDSQQRNRNQSDS